MFILGFLCGIIFIPAVVFIICLVEAIVEN